MKRIITAALACAMIISSLCACGQKQPDTEPAPLPEKYSLVDEGLVTPPKNQGETGMCPTFSLINSCESNLLVRGYESVDDLDLSEACLYYYNFTFRDDEPFGLSTDGYVFGDLDRSEFNMSHLRIGGEKVSLVNMLANGMGPADESAVKFNSFKLNESVDNLKKADEGGAITRFTGDYLLTEANFYNNLTYVDVYQPASFEDIKRGIIENGAASCSTTTSQFCYHRTPNGVAYYEGEYSDDEIYFHMGHEVSIIGWDDSFSRDNFGYVKPENDGAWLIKDSCQTRHGDYYYWSSYDQLLGVICTVGLEPRGDYGDILFYDSIKMRRNIKAPGGETVAANVFAADKDCALKAVGVPTSAIDQPVVIEVRRNPDKYTPDSGERAARVETIIGMGGYHVVDLEEPVALSEGDTFSIIIRYAADKTGENEWLGVVPVEGDLVPEEKERLMDAENRCVFSSNPGESYVVYEGKWYDCSLLSTGELFGLEVPLNNFGIKALMENTQ